MIKNLALLIILSLLAIIGMHYAEIGLHGLLTAHTWISETLKEVFTGGQAGNISRELIALLAVPFLVGLVPALLYWFAKRKWLPCFMQIVWVIWLIQTSAIIAVSRTLLSAATGA